MLPEVYLGVVTTITWEEDAPSSLLDGGDDENVGGGCSVAGNGHGGDDDYLEGGTL